MVDHFQAHPSSLTSNLVHDFLQYKLNQRGHAWEGHPPTPRPTTLMRSLRRVADFFEVKNRSELDEMFANLSINPHNAQVTYLGVIDELFSEGVTWGRLVAMFAFGGEMAVQITENQMAMLLEPLAEWMVAYIDDHLANWIHDHGGWEAFTEFCNLNEDDLKPARNKVRWGLAVGVISALTVGAFLSR